MTDEFILSPRTPVDLGQSAEIADAPVERIGSWLLYQAYCAGEAYWVREYFPAGLVTRGAGNAPRLTISGDDAGAAWAMGQDRFDILADQLQDVRHPGVLTVTRRSPAGEGPLLIGGPRIEGDASIASHLAQRKRFSPNGVMVLAGQIAEALIFLHAKEILHRDIRPETVVLRGRQAMLANFAIDERKYMRVLGSKTGLVHPPYSPIELYDDQARDSITPSTDIYSASAMLYELIVDAPAPAWRERREGAGLSALSTARGYPPGFLQAIEKGLALRAEEAFVTVEEWRDAMGVGAVAPDLAGWFAPEKSVVTGKWPIRVGAALLVVAIVAVTAIRLANHGSNRPRRDFVADTVETRSSPVASVQTPPNAPSASTSSAPTPAPTPTPTPTPIPAPTPSFSLDMLRGTWRVGGGSCDHRIAIPGEGQIEVNVAGLKFSHRLVGEPRWNIADQDWSFSSSIVQNQALKDVVYTWTLKSGDERELRQEKAGSKEAPEIWRLCSKKEA